MLHQMKGYSDNTFHNKQRYVLLPQLVQKNDQTNYVRETTTYSFHGGSSKFHTN